MARICSFASGSSGNCTLLSDYGNHILVDMGISFKRTATALSQLGLGIGDLSAILVTHSHSDHISGLNTLCKKWSVPVLATKQAAVGIAKSCPEAARNLIVFEPGASFSLKGFGVRSFPTPHDSDGSVCYRISCSCGDVGIMTDLGYVPPAVLEGMEGVAAILIEFNHDVNRLAVGPYPYHLKQRILSDRGHLSNEAAGDAARWLAERGTKRFLLSHLSKENNTPQLAYKAAVSALGDIEGVTIHISPPEMGRPIEF